MYGYIYETTNLINGKKYIGLHTAKKFEGNKYLGSGINLIKDIEKYGKQNFKVVLIETCNSLQELEEHEIFHININNAVENPKYYNIAPGGHAGGGKCIPSKESRIKMSVAAYNRGNCLTEEGKKKCTHFGEDNGFYNCKHSESTREYLSKIHRGRIWINNGLENKHIHIEELDSYIQQGYRKGMKPKHHDTLNRIWIHNPISQERKMIFKSEMDNYIGWKLGVGKRKNSPRSSETIESVGSEKYTAK